MHRLSKLNDAMLDDRNGVGNRALAVAAERLMAPDMSVMRLNRRPPPRLPLDVFGPSWRTFVEQAAAAAACPVDYVAGPLIASASALIGNARWAQATPGWSEPPHLWCCSVGDSGGGKSPGADALLRDVLPRIETNMQGDFPDRLRNWQVAAEVHKAAVEQWQRSVRDAQNDGKGAVPPQPPQSDPPPEPQAPRLRQTDVTIERVATLLASAAPKGLLIVRDELAGWLLGMNAYNDAGREFWIEAYGGRHYRVERQKYPHPIDVTRLVVAVFGGTQPDKLAALMQEADDGLLARICWFWPEPVPFRLSRTAPGIDAAIVALDRLRLLDLRPGLDATTPPMPVMVPLADAAVPLIESFGQEMQARQAEAGGLMVSAQGKARGTALRLALVLEYLWWCGDPGMSAPPATISADAFTAAAHMVSRYLMPMAERVYGDAAARPEDRNAATLARWIMKKHPKEVHVRKMQREERLHGLNTADAIHTACRVLIDAGWLMPPHEDKGYQQRARAAYPVNPAIWLSGA